MINIFLESKNDSTPEYVFIRTLLRHLQWPEDSFRIIPVNGKDSLHLAKNQFLQNTLEGGVNLIIFDADSPANSGGYHIRKTYLSQQISHLGIEADIFLFPNDCEDGDFETLLEGVARTDLHAAFFDCFRDYELCLGESYVHPNRKGKLHAYITSMPMSNRKRRKIGAGEWLFSDSEYWNLDSPALLPLATFLSAYVR